MLNHVVPRDELQAKVDSIAEEIKAMPAFGLTLAKKVINTNEDQMGLQTSLDSAFGWHMFAHSANAEPDDTDSFSASLGGMDARSMRDSANTGSTGDSAPSGEKKD